MKKFLRFCKKTVLDIIYRVNYKVVTRKAGDPINDLPSDKFFRLDIPTYDGSGQAVHPSLLVSSDDLSACSPRFVLSFTPYTDTDDRVENPSVVISDDGIHFREEKKGLNPLVPAPDKDHNDDPELFFRDGKYGILYLETMRPEKQSLVLLESTDRIHWEKRILHQENLAGGSGCFMLSPKYLEKDGLSWLFYVNRDAAGGYRIEYVTGKDIYSFDFDTRNVIKIKGDKVFPWHLDVVECHPGAGQDRYIMLLTTASGLEKEARYTLRIVRSGNLTEWELEPSFALPDCYRSSGFIKDGVLYLYVSKIFLPAWRRKRWNILLYKAKMPEAWRMN